MLQCCACLEKITEDTCYSLDSNTSASNDVNLKEKLLYCVPELTPLIEGMPKWLCSICYEVLNSSYTFIKMCLKVKSKLELLNSCGYDASFCIELNDTNDNEKAESSNDESDKNCARKQFKQNLFVCNICETQFRNKFLLNEHQKLHNTNQIVSESNIGSSEMENIEKGEILPEKTEETIEQFYLDFPVGEECLTIQNQNFLQIPNENFIICGTHNEKQIENTATISQSTSTTLVNANFEQQSQQNLYSYNTESALQKQSGPPVNELLLLVTDSNTGTNQLLRIVPVLENNTTEKTIKNKPSTSIGMPAKNSKQLKEKCDYCNEMIKLPKHVTTNKMLNTQKSFSMCKKCQSKTNLLKAPKKIPQNSKTSSQRTKEETNEFIKNSVEENNSTLPSTSKMYNDLIQLLGLTNNDKEICLNNNNTTSPVINIHEQSETTKEPIELSSDLITQEFNSESEIQISAIPTQLDFETCMEANKIKKKTKNETQSTKNALDGYYKLNKPEQANKKKNIVSSPQIQVNNSNNNINQAESDCSELLEKLTPLEKEIVINAVKMKSSKEVTKYESNKFIESESSAESVLTINLENKMANFEGLEKTANALNKSNKKYKRDRSMSVDEEMQNKKGKCQF